MGHAYPASTSWLEAASHHFTDDNIAGCTGDVYIDEKGTLWEVIRAKFLGRLRQPGIRRHTKNSLFGNLDVFNGGEDKEWALYFIKQGYTFITDPGFSVYHCHGDNFNRMLKRQYRYALMYLGAYMRYRSSHR